MVYGGETLQPARGGARQGPGAMIGLGCANHHVCNVLHIDGAPIARGDQQQPDIWHALQRLPGDDRDIVVELIERADQERAVGVFELVDKLIERDAVKRQPFRIGLDPDSVGTAADNVGQPTLSTLTNSCCTSSAIW
jgi:hypothetical protein